jgi:hypothetical protein
MLVPGSFDCGGFQATALGELQKCERVTMRADCQKSVRETDCLHSIASLSRPEKPKRSGRYARGELGKGPPHECDEVLPSLPACAAVLGRGDLCHFRLPEMVA